VAEHAVHMRREAIARQSFVDDRDAPAGAGEHQTRAEPGWATADNEHIA